jgi:Family of unknown function (DUF6325)
MPATLDADSLGPVDIAVILFEGNKFNGDVAPALADLNDSGTVRIIDYAFVRKETDGSALVVEAGDEEVTELSDFHATQYDLLSEEDLTAIADGLDENSSALVIVWENTWAARLAAAIRGSHGQLISQDRIPRENVLAALAALDEE